LVAKIEELGGEFDTGGTSAYDGEVEEGLFEFWGSGGEGSEFETCGFINYVKLLRPKLADG
jgi:hypothetical protein